MDQNTLPPDEFVDSVLAFAALMSFQDYLLSRVDLQADSPEATLFKLFATKFRSLGGTLDAGLRTYGVPMADEVRRKTRFQVGLTGRLVVIPDFKQISEVAEKRMDAIEDLFPVVFRRFDVAESIIADARALSSFKKITRAIMISDPVGRLSELARVPATSSAGSSFVQLIDRACKYAGVEIPTLDVSIREASQATALGDDLRKVDVQLQATDPGDATSAELADKRSEIVGKINDLTANAVAPEAVKAAVATSVVSADGYATSIGKQERLSSAQEQGVLATGKVLLAAGAGSGKSVRGDTITCTSKGLARIDECQDASMVVSMDPNTLETRMEPGTWLDMGTGSLIRIQTRSGIRVEATPEHPFLLWTGKAEWVRTENIKPGDFVMVQPGYAVGTGVEHGDPDEAYLHGLFMGDGFVSSDEYSVGWSRGGDFLPAHYYSLAQKFWGKTPKSYEKEGTQSVSHFINSKELVTKLKAQGLAFSSARNKAIPAWLMGASDAERIRFMQGLFDTDGTATGEREFEWCSASETLARQVHQLLIGQGVVGMLKPKIVKGYEDHTYWRVIVSGDQLRTFRDVVGFRYEFKKAADLDDLCDKVCNPNVGVYPHVSDILKAVRETWKSVGRWNGRNQATLMDDRWVSVKDYLLGRRCPSKAQLLRMVGDLDSPAATILRNLTSFYPDEVVSVEILQGEHQVYDFNVPATQAFVANGIVSHNTKVMASKVVYFIKEMGVPPQSIIATSFSRKSAKELTERVKKYGGENILQGKENGFGTSHSVAAKIVNKYAKDIGLGNVVQLQGGDQTKLVRLAMEQVKMAGSAGQSPNPDEDLLALGGKREYNPGETTRDLGEYAKDLQVSIQRLQDKLDENPNDYRLKFTLSTLNRILSEGRTQDMLSQQEKMLLQQAFAEAGVTQRVASVQRQAAFEGKAVTLGAEANRFYKESARKWFNLGIDKEHFVDIDGRPIGARRIQTFISKNKGGLKAPGAVAAGPIRDYQKALEMKLDEKEIAGAREAAIFAACYGAYEWLKKNAISGDFMEGSDFDDILINCCRVLMHSDAARSNIQKHIKVLIVDEGQDSNPCQVLMYGLIAGTHNKDGTKKEDNTMTASTFALVGDEKQSIYAFRGAEPELFINASDANGGDFKTLYLTDNYRSGSAIVEAANAVASHLSKTIPMVCKAHPSRGEGSIHCDIVKDNQEGASMFADTIAKMCKGELASEKFSDFGLGVRTNAEAMAYGVELLKRAIPFKSKLNFFNTPTAKAMIDWMNLGTLDSSNIPAMNEAVLRAHRSPNFYLDQAFTQALESQARNQNYYEWMLKGGWQKLYSGKQEWRKKFVKSYVDAITAVRNQLRGSTDAETFIQFILDLPGGEMKGQTSTMLSSLIEEVKGSPEAMDMLVQESEGGRVTEEQIEAFALAPIQPLLSIAKDKTDIRGCVQYVQRLKQVNDTKSHDDEEDVDAVIIDTVHGWKGLECKHMYIPMSQGTFPHARSLSSPAEEDSERRLAYVALTRGRESVTVIAPRVNLFGKQVEPSQFVYEGCIPVRGGEDKSSMDAEKEVMKLESQRSASVLVTSEDLKALAENDAEYLETRVAEIEMGSTWGGL